jgi:asparagine synthase (glutamine-hydrolysing)
VRGCSIARAKQAQDHRFFSDEANQPFDYMDLVIIFNGEMYNYIEVREELLKLGYKFRTKGDTEVIGAAYKEWGES